MPYSPTWHLNHPVIKKPYDVQVEGMKRVHGHRKYGWFLEQGLGKTALQLNDYIENMSDLDTAVVICPNTFKLDWAMAPEEWGVPEIKGSVWPVDEMTKGATGTPRFNVMNFESARASGYYALRDLMDKRPCALIVDESSFCKNFKSQTAKAVLDLSKRAHEVRLLNGTPMVQNPMDLFPQLKMLGELDKVNPFAFRNRFTVMGGFMGKQIIGVRNEEELHELQARCSFRALKKDWSDLPEKIPVPLRLEMTDKQRKHYREMLEDFCTLVAGQEFSASLVLSQMDKCRQIASGILIDGDSFKLIEEPEKNPKIRAALELMEAGSGKMIIVHFYTKMGEVIFDQMAKNKLNPAYIRGGMSPQELREQKAKFNNDASSRVIVCQINSACMAHTLLGGEGDDRCHKMFFHDQTFSLRDRKQMEDRNHRGAQDRACLYYDPIMSPIDEAQAKAIKTKSDMVAVVVDAVRALRASGGRT